MQVALISCIDPRLHQRSDGRNYVAQFCIEKGYEPFLILRAGGILQLVHPTEGGLNNSIIHDVGVAVRHGAEKIVLLNHTDCRAYRDVLELDPDREFSQHLRHMRAAERILRDFFEVPIGRYLAALQCGSEDDFVIHDADIFGS